MSILGRRRHLRYLLTEPVEGKVWVRDEVTIESLSPREIVVLCSEPCRPDEHVSLEFLGSARRRVSATVAESRPAMAEDGAIRHRLRLVLSSAEDEMPTAEEVGR